jgi:oligopeptide transport system substrate-binding protein
MIRRRTFLACGPLVAACARADHEYFGNTDPPHARHLVTTLDNEPSSLDPHLSSGRIDSVILAMFEGLTSLHPVTAEPMAALATHYERSADGLAYTFYLRGCLSPRGVRLPNTTSLALEFSRGRSAPADAVQAQWSDGVPITAADFVFSWRRVISPSTAAQLAYLLHPLRNAQRIISGKLTPDRLGVRALDDYTVQADLEIPTPYFLELVASRVFAAVPRHVVDNPPGERWTEPLRMVTSGAFRLRSHRPYDSIVLEKNSRYYDSGQVSIDEVTVLVTRDLTTLVNQYRAGVAMLAYPAVPAMLPLLRRKRDFRPHPAYGAAFLNVNTTTPPLDDVRVRYALNMAIDKRPVSELFGAGWIPATGLVPAGAGYGPPKSLPLSIEGQVYDVLSFHPSAARELLVRIGKRLPSTIEYVVPNSPDDVLWAQVMKEQWRRDLGIDLAVLAVDFQQWIEMFHGGKFRHLANAGSEGAYIDPVWFLDEFNRPAGNGTHWNDPNYQIELAEAKRTADPLLRLSRLAQCEGRLLEAMPILPLAYWVDAILVKPYLRGLGNNLLDRQQFKYIWIDRNWRPE